MENLSTRNVIFLSHATPEDNEFTRWLGLQLAQEGYSIWSDVTHLLGGETFWDDIETAIRNHTSKFIFVLSRTSNIRQGALDELHLAKTVAKALSLHDFIIPLRIDDLPFSDINVALHRTNAIDFSKSWADGLSKLMEKLEKENTPKSPENYNRGTVASWWRDNFDGQNMLRDDEEFHLSNWFEFTSYPDFIYVHEVAKDAYVGNAIFPYYGIGNSIISFATAEDLLISECTASTQITMGSVLNWEDNLSRIATNELRNAATFILKEGISSAIRKTNLGVYEMANNRKCYYFKPEHFSSKYVHYDIENVKSGKRSLVGKVKSRTWHFGLSFDVQFEPMPLVVARTHVLFSEDGQTLLYSDKVMNALRRSACKQWWNQHWRDRLLASVAWISEKLETNTCIRAELGTIATAAISRSPVLFSVPIAYDDNFFIHDDILEECDDDVNEVEEIQE